MKTDLFGDFPFEDFYTYSDQDTKGCYWLEPFPDQQVKYPDIITDPSISSPTYIIRKGKVWTDLIFCAWPGLHIMSQRMRDALDGATGLRFYPVNILDKELRAIDVDYYGFHVTGRCGSYIKSMSRSEVARRVPTGPEFIRKVGLYFDPDTWDKHEFFVPEGTAGVLISKRIHDIILYNNFTNISMQSIVDVQAY